MALETEMAVYRSNLMELLINEGSYVVIKGEEILPPVGTYEEALSAGYSKFGPGPFLVKQISRVEPILYFSRDLT
jgi:hypothetical protein